VSVHHHLDNATLLRYASGNLEEAFSVVVASHLAVCAECRRDARIAEAVGGEMLDAVDQAELSEGAFERLMKRVDSDDEPITVTRDTIAGDVPVPLQRFVGPSLDAISWKTVSPGVRRHAISLPGPSGSSLNLLHISPGTVVPEHGHGGTEMTFVLSGSYRDEFGLFGPGDIADLDEHVEHQPRVEGDEPCICIVATESPTRFKGFFSRLLQPLVGI